LPIYEYRCDEEGEFEVMRPIGTAPATLPCPVCGTESRRVFSMPMLRSASKSGWNSAIDHAEKSRFEPDVVRSLPPSRAANRTAQMTPALRSLPRP
jgi:putative FmdB family regulatory protein